MGKSSAPEPTDPKDTAAAQTGTNVSTAISNAFLGNVNQITPDGTLTYEQTGSRKQFDPYTGQTYDIPTFTQTQTLSAEQEAIKAESDAAKLNLAGLANDQSGFLQDYMADPFSYSVGNYEQWAGDLYGKLNDTQISQAEESLRTRLANQGIKAGSEAYDREMQNFATAQGNSRNQFMLDAYGTGLQTALTERNQPINEIIGLMSGSQVAAPNFTSTNSPQMQNTDVASIIANADNQKMTAWQQNQAAAGSLLSGLGGLFALSDERAKEDKKKIGETDDGLGLYSFRYKGSPETQIGLMAQDVKKKKPKAVKTRPDGLMAVDYAEALK